MPHTIVYNFGDVVLVPFPFTDQSGAKKRPAVVISSAVYNSARPDLVLMAITGQARGAANVGEMDITEWQKAGLLKASVVKPILTTIERRLVVRKLGRLEVTDRTSLRSALGVIFG